MSGIGASQGSQDGFDELQGFVLRHCNNDTALHTVSFHVTCTEQSVGSLTSILQ